MRVRLLIAVLLGASVGLAACSVNVDFGEETFLCMSEPRECRDGFICENGLCVRPGSTDSGAIDGATFDGPPVAPVIPAFGPPTAITELLDVTAGSDDASYSSDRLYVLFNSNRNNASELYTSRRLATTDSWRAPVAEAVLNSVSNETTVAVSADGLRVMFASDRSGGPGGFDVYLASRSAIEDAWSSPMLAAGLNSADNDVASWISNDGLSAIIHSDREGNFDLFIAARVTTDDPFDQLTPMTELNSTANDDSGRFARGGLVITFHSDRAGGAGNADIYGATRATLEEPFGPVAPIVGVNTENLDEDAWLSDDLCYIAYATLIEGASGNQLVEATCVP